MEKKTYDLEERLIEFGVGILNIADMLPNSMAGRHFAGQLIRSGTSPGLNYGEAQSAESRKDFVHKIKIILKELRETLVCLKIIKRVPLIKQSEVLDLALNESNELVSIFIKSVQAAKANLAKEKGKEQDKS